MKNLLVKAPPDPLSQRLGEGESIVRTRPPLPELGEEPGVRAASSHSFLIVKSITR